MTWLQVEPITLAGGRESRFKVECDHLSDEEVQAACDLLALLLPPFGYLYGVPTGGERVAAALEKYRDPAEPVILVVDDVWTTGGSMRAYMDAEGIPTHRGAVLFARGPVPSWVTPLWIIHPGLWEA